MGPQYGPLSLKPGILIYLIYTLKQRTVGCYGFRVWGLGLRVGLGFRVQGLWVQGLGFRVQGLWVQGLNDQGFRAQGGVQGLGFRVRGFRVQMIRVFGLRFLRLQDFKALGRALGFQGFRALGFGVKVLSFQGAIWVLRRIPQQEGSIKVEWITDSPYCNCLRQPWNEL